jgi:outer membrane protein assembly factor BamE (lipoprotein component of BamABCDE complex)
MSPLICSLQNVRGKVIRQRHVLKNLVRKEVSMQERAFWKGALFVVLIAGSLLLMDLAGCSVYMAAKQPSEKNLEVMSVGTPRNVVLAELGTPAATETRDGKKVDVFSFVQGYSKGSKTGRAVFHGVADVFTLGLWEVVGTPTEAIFDGTKVMYEITYDEGNRVEIVIALTEKSKVEAQKHVREPVPKPGDASAKSADSSAKPVVEAEQKIQ